MAEYVDKHSEQVVSRIDSLLASVTLAISNWEVCRTNYNLTDDIVAEGTKIIKELKDAKDT